MRPGKPGSSIEDPGFPGLLTEEKVYLIFIMGDDQK